VSARGEVREMFCWEEELIMMIVFFRLAIVVSSEPAYIVALNSAQYGGGYPGPQCFKSITITGGNRNGHAVATIKDE